MYLYIQLSFSLFLYYGRLLILVTIIIVDLHINTRTSFISIITRIILTINQQIQDSVNYTIFKSNHFHFISFFITFIFQKKYEQTQSTTTVTTGPTTDTTVTPNITTSTAASTSRTAATMTDFTCLNNSTALMPDQRVLFMTCMFTMIIHFNFDFN